MTYSELVALAQHPNEPLIPEITSRSFVARAARTPIAMRRLSREEFWLELEKRGYHRVSEEDDLGSFWLGPHGTYFQVPLPDADYRYPDWPGGQR